MGAPRFYDTKGFSLGQIDSKRFKKGVEGPREKFGKRAKGEVGKKNWGKG